MQIPPNNYEVQKSHNYMGPYGVRFEEVDLVRKGEQKQYMKDLDYLLSLRDGRHGDMNQQEWEAYNRKLRYMNDVSI